MRKLAQDEKDVYLGLPIHEEEGWRWHMPEWLSGVGKEGGGEGLKLAEARNIGAL